MKPTLNIASTPTLIFGSEHTCILDGLVLANQTDSTIIVSLYILREVVQNNATEFSLANKIILQPNERTDILDAATLTLESGDLLYAYSDFSGNTFNSFVSYRELTELGGTPHG
jgi:hypothetical protein